MKSITSIFANYNKLQLILPKYHIQALSVAAILAAILNFSERHQPCQIMLAISDPTDITRHLGIYHDMLTDGVRPHLHLSSDCHPTKWFFHVFVKTKTYIYIYFTRQSKIIIHLIRNLCFHIQIIHLRISVQLITKIVCSIALIRLSVIVK